MKKNFPLVIATLTLPMVLGGCVASIGENNGTTSAKETYTMKGEDYLTIRYLNNKIDVYTIDQYHNEALYDGSHYWVKGPFTIKIVYWEMGIDVKVSGMSNYSDITFVYRGIIDYHLISYSDTVQNNPSAA